MTGWTAFPASGPGAGAATPPHPQPAIVRQDWPLRSPGLPVAGLLAGTARTEVTGETEATSARHVTQEQFRRMPHSLTALFPDTGRAVNGSRPRGRRAHRPRLVPASSPVCPATAPGHVPPPGPRPPARAAAGIISPQVRAPKAAVPETDPPGLTNERSSMDQAHPAQRRSRRTAAKTRGRNVRNKI